MRTQIMLVLAALLLLAVPGVGHALGGPSAAGQESAAQAATGTPQAVPSTPPAPAEWQLSNKFMSEDGKNPPYTIRITKPVLEAYSDDAFNHSVDDYLNATLNDFKNFGNVPSDPNLPSSSLDITYDLLSSGGGILSLRFRVATYSAGAAHPTSFSHTLTYDLNSGTIMTLASLFKPDAKYLDVIAKYAADDLQRRGLLNFPDGASPKPENYQNWNIERGGLLITFDVGQVGPNAQGPTDVWIPYQVVADIVQTGGLPAWWWY